MAIKVQFDTANNPLPPRLILATKSGNRIRQLPISDVVFKDTLVNGSEFSFTVHKTACVDRNKKIDESFWRRITDFKLAYCPEYDMWYEIYVQIDENDETVKTCSAVSLGEAELSQINVHDIEINTEADIEREDYKPTVLYSPDDKSISLVDRLLYKAPHYHVKYVDDSIAGIQRTFRFDNKSIYDCYQEVAKEINCLFKFECSKSDDGKIDRAISVYDMENVCRDCGKRGDFVGVCDKCGSSNIRMGYGEDTTIFVSKDNLAENITYSTDVDSVKNCFRLEAGDDLMTATVVNCNPNGSQYIWYISDELKEDMSPALRQRLNDYEEMYELYQDQYGYRPPEDLLTQYNAIVEKYLPFDEELQKIPEQIVGYPQLMTAYYNTIDLQLFLNSGLMPNVDTSGTTAAKEAQKLDGFNLSPIAVSDLESCTPSTAASAALGMAKCLVRGTYQVKVKESSYDAVSHVWCGNFTITNYSDEEDTADSEMVNVTITEDLERYIRQKITRTMAQRSDDITDVSELFKLDLPSFQTEMQKYSMQRLLAFRDACQASLDILIQQGVADKESWASKDDDLYTNLFLPFRDKMSAIESEILQRSNELAVVAGVRDENGGILSDGMQSLIEAHRNEIQEIQNFEAFLGPELWEEFASYRREDTYSNNNYISDGLNNEELFARALEFIAIAEKEIVTSATLQHSVTSTLSDLLSMREFAPIVHMFACGNWIRIEVDENVYRLRLSEYSVQYNDWTLDVEFTDVKFGHDSASDIESVLEQAKNMTTSYGAVTRQAESGKKSKETLDDWASSGFKLTTKIIGGADNQEFIIDESGITGREYIPETGSYSPEQVKLISSGLYVTDDGWLTARTGIGRFTFTNPKTNREETRYGVIADVLVGNMLLSKEAGIYNDSGSVTLDEDGFTLITERGDGAKTFRIIRKNDDGTLTNILSIDSNGNLQLNASSSVETGDGLMTLEEIANKGVDQDQINAAIEVNNGRIMTLVNNRLLETTTQLIQNDNSLEARVTQNEENIGEITTAFRVTANGAEISKSDSDTVMEISNDQISMKVNGQVVTYWNINEQYMPKMVNIPVGGSLRLGSIQFQPRSSGNVSVLWVGDS